MTTFYIENPSLVNTEFTLFNEFGQNYKKIINNLPDLSRNEKRFLTHIAFREYKNGFCSECQKSIARILNLAVSTIRRLTKKLITKGYLKTELPELKKRRSLNSKIIYKILSIRFVKKQEKHGIEKKMSAEMSAESTESTFINNKILKPTQGGPVFSEKFLNKKKKKGFSEQSIQFALTELKKNKAVKNKYSLFSFLLKEFYKKEEINMKNENEKRFVADQAQEIEKKQEVEKAILRKDSGLSKISKVIKNIMMSQEERNEKQNELRQQAKDILKPKETDTGHKTKFLGTVVRKEKLTPEQLKQQAVEAGLL